MNIADALADRIRTMSDDELAEKWCEWAECWTCPVYIDCMTNDQDCKKLVLDYLKARLIK